MLKMRTSLLMFLVVLGLPGVTEASDWPEWRGPARDGISAEKGLPERWTVAGDGLAWSAPYGGRSSPVVLGDHLYLLNTYSKGDIVQERLLCLNADTGKMLWERRFNVFQSDVPMHRIAWASPAADPETGNVYVFAGGGTTLIGFSKDGKQLWDRAINQEFNLFTTHGGRTVSPVVEGDLVIIASASSSWGTQSNRAHRFMAFDKRTGDCIWVSSPGGRPYDTTYSTPIVADVNGTRLLISGSGDGGIHAMKLGTGEVVWDYEAAKRGINTGVVMAGKYAIVTHSEENLDTSEMGLIAAIDATGHGKLGKAAVKWATTGVQAGYSTPIADGDRIYVVDNGSNLFAFDSVGGKQLWKQNLGSIQKASPVVADGKIYVGTESGKFWIIRPHGDRAEILSDVEMPISSQGLASERVPEPILAGAAVARGRVYFVSSDHLYAIGPKQARNVQAPRPQAMLKGDGAPAWVQVIPTELTLRPGQTVKLRARLFDDKGRFLKEDAAVWTLEGLKGDVASGAFTAASENKGQAGLIKATVGGISGSARARVVPNFPWNEDFESMAEGSVPPYWVGAVAGKYQVATLDGSKVMAKPANETLFKRMRLFIGSPDASDYTVEADVRAAEKRRQIGDAGITAQTYSLVLFGNRQRIEMWPWQENTHRVISLPFEWKPDTWYHLKLKVQNQADGKTHVQGKAWKTGDPEPAQWMIDKVDDTPNRKGSPGLFADAQFGAFFDNLKVTANQ
jgi:outer membrane protein assembly factor BamB